MTEKAENNSKKVKDKKIKDGNIDEVIASKYCTVISDKVFPQLCKACPKNTLLIRLKCSKQK